MDAEEKEEIISIDHVCMLGQEDRRTGGREGQSWTNMGRAESTGAQGSQHTLKGMLPHNEKITICFYNYFRLAGH